MKRIATLLALTSLSLAASCSSDRAPGAPSKAQESAVLEARTCGSLARLHSFGDLYLASQPTPADFEELKALGIRTVIDLRPPAEHPDLDESKVVPALGLEYLNLPIAGPGGMDDATITRARELLQTAKRPLLVHCASANRVGAVWVPWRVLDGGIGIDQALAEAREIGLRSPELEGKARDYVLHHAGGK